MKRFLVLLVCLCLLAIGPVAAVPTTDAATSVTNNKVTLNMHGTPLDCWFKWGMASDNLIYFTPNETSCISGTFTVIGSPLLTGTTYYAKACDQTGCGAAVSFTTLAATPTNRTYYSEGLNTIMQSGFNMTQAVPIIWSPYSSVMTAPVMWGLLFMFIFAAMWLRQRDIVVPMTIAMIAGALIWSGTSALGVPPEWADLGMGLMYAGFAGVVFSWFTR